ncbi:coiled-coil domain-containing protein 187 isoform X2 [Patagioenas fasciata]|uniref:coiled-coil domain-containing protein 187 isoform X2 n=1 Tax=Patagioenas fasciata TaxID=372321 RepID=UPI0032E8812A
MDNRFATGESGPLADVALAWQSLQKAKAVLQRIENKFYHQTWSCAKSQAARRKLWQGKSFDVERNGDETALNERKSNEIPPARRKRSCAAVSPAWPQTCSLERPTMSFGPSRMSPLSPSRGSRSAPCSPLDGEGTAGTRSPAKSLYKPRRDSFREQADLRGRTTQKEKSPCCLHHPPCSPAESSPFSAVPPEQRSHAHSTFPPSHLPSASKPSDRKLEELWKTSPQRKLEQLKKRIQEQKQKQQAASQKCLISACAQEPLQKRAVKRKVCRAGSAPPAPAYRAFGAVNLRSAPRSPGEEQRAPRREAFAIPGQGRDHKKAPKTPGVKPPGASAWREGQKIARKLLGPPPTFPNLRSTTEEQITANTLEPGRGFVATPVMENSPREKGNQPVRRSPEFQSCLIPHSKHIERGSNTPSKDSKQILRNLHLQSQYQDEHKCTRFPKDTVERKVEVLQQYLRIHSPPPGPQGRTPSVFNGEEIQSSLVKDGAKPSTSGNCRRGKSTTPQRQQGSSSPAQKGSAKENLKHPSKRMVIIKKAHPYSSEVVQEFMYRKNEERKKKILEEKKSLVQAMELRNKRLQEVYRKQKAAIAKKTCSDQIHKLTRETSSAKESPACKLEQEQTSDRILERSFTAWVDKTSCTLLSKDHRGRNQLLDTVQAPKKRAASASPAPLESECWFLSPLKCEGSRDCSPPALQAPPVSFSLPQKEPYSKDSTSGLSPYRSKQDRVKAIHSLCKELAEKIEMATKRLNGANMVKDSADKTSRETTLDLFNELSSIPEPETSKDEQDRTMTIHMLLDTPDPDVLHVSAGRGFHGLGRISLAGSTVGATALGRQKEKPTPLAGGSEELLWITHSAGLRHLNTREDLSNTLQGFPVNKDSKMDISLLHEKPITGPASPSHRFLAGSPQTELTAQRNHHPCETVLKVQNQEEDANRSPRESLRTRDSLRSLPSATPSPGAETPQSFEQDLVSAGEGDPNCTALEEKHRRHLDNLRQTSLLLAHKLKAHQLQQEQQLTVLREKAKLEVQENQRFLSDLLQHNSAGCSSSRGGCSVVKLDHEEQMQMQYQLEGGNIAGSNQETNPLKQSTLKIGRDHNPADPKTPAERKLLGGRGSYCSVLPEGPLPAEHREPLHGRRTWTLLPPPVNLHGETCAGDNSGESSEQASSDSQWSEVGRHYGGSRTFCHFSLAMVEQCLRGEELRARHQAALLELRRKALREKARAELAWLGHQKRCLEHLQDSKGASAMAAKQHNILRELKQEQAEIQHLQNIYRAAHQERKLLLKHQREILMMRHSTAQLQGKLHRLAGKQEVIKSQSADISLTRSPATEEAIKLNTMRLISSPKFYSSSAESTAHPETPDLSGSRESCVQLKNKQTKKYESFSTENKKTSAQHQEQAEESPGSEQPLGVRCPCVSEVVTKTVHGATSQTMGSVSMGKDYKNTELNAQGGVLLPLEHANSARLDDPISTPTAREGTKCAFLESVLNEKALISSPKMDPKDNEDINPCDSKFTVEGLEMLSALCNLSLVQAENTLQGTDGATSSLEDVQKESLIVEKAPKQHLDGVSHGPSDEEVNLKAFSEGLASTESSSKSNNFPLRCESAKSGSSLPEFQKVSAVCIDISESSISDSELELKNAEDTDVSIPEEFDDNGDVFHNVSKEMLIAVSNGKEMLPSDKYDEREVPEDESTRTSSRSQKYSGDVSDHGCADHLLPSIPSDKVKASETKSGDSSQSDNPAKGTDELHLDASESYSKTKTCSQEITKQGKDAVARSSCSDDIYSLKIYEQQQPSSTTNRVKNDVGMNSLFVDQNRDLLGFPLMGSLKHLDSVTDQLRNTVSLPPDKDITNSKLLACLSSRNLSVSGGENNHAQLLNERLTSSKLDEIGSLPTPMPGISEEVHTENNSFESLQRVATEYQNNSATEKQAIKEAGEGLFSSVSSKKQLFQAEKCSSKSDYTIFIGDEGLPPAAEGTLSEILSPVDEVLSYGSADLPSSNKKALSFPSEDLPPAPLGADAMKNDDSTFSMDDFPPPPEQMTVSESRQCMDEDTSLQMDALPPLPDNAVPEEFPLLDRGTTDAFSTQDGSVSEQSLVKDVFSVKEGLLEYQQGEHKTPWQNLEFLTVSNPISSGQASKSPNFTMKQCKTYLMSPKAEEDSDDPLLAFEIGDRVLVKQTQPGTLMFKGRTNFDSGHWAGVALDKAQGDNSGTYKGVKYFACPRHCGVFVRPEEISHLLGADENGPNYLGDEDSDSYDDEPFKGDRTYPEDDEQGGLAEPKAEDTNSAGGSEVKENRSGLHTASLAGKGQKVPYSDQHKCNEFLCQNNSTCVGSAKEKTELTHMELFSE